MDERERRIRERAHRLWEEEGRPEGRAESHWFQAKEIVAIEEGHPEMLKPVEAAEREAAEPIEALANAGEFPTLTDQGEMQIPHRPEPVSDGGLATNGVNPEEPAGGGGQNVRSAEEPRRGKKRPRAAPSEL
ncbi:MULTISPECIES: DUF2934 domain-containing protein [unclassified Chelatococcus]|uniref:DUF2934 domain-containing protein n=1 Tax=unclassified Chelatococcus TaxID=2638111 RepID=UPI001BD17A24|nr:MULTISPECIES: DUF2934 domain-containing protein [unclassified Chelatococcus]MBS7696513.1 DUF2934 domain-containing protein [Chelatococcus sp. YT9]MBX3555079.1 DUF2934 domain-containing protein [Chelatococcus sp.]